MNNERRQWQSVIVILSSFTVCFMLAFYAPENKITEKAIDTITTLGVGYVIYKQGRELRGTDKANRHGEIPKIE